MRKYAVVVMISISSVFLLIACSDQENEDLVNEKDTADVQEDQVDDSDQTESESNEAEADDSTESSSTDNEAEESNSQTASEEEHVLSDYSTTEIEYARVWLQLGENQEIDELNVTQIPAGEPLNPGDETSANYPEDVVQLAGSRLIDGSITYSSNEDGTVNVYNVPLRWDGQHPAGEEFYQEMIEQTTEEAIAPGDDEKVIELIQLLHN